MKHIAAVLRFFWATLIWNMGHIAINLYCFPVINCNCFKLIRSYCQLKRDKNHSCSELNGEIQQTYLLLLATFQVLLAETWHTSQILWTPILLLWALDHSTHHSLFRKLPSYSELKHLLINMDCYLRTNTCKINNESQKNCIIIF